MRVVLVDDNDAVRRALAKGLEHAGQEVLQASSGAAAMMILRQSKVDVIVTDICMPGRDGIEVLLEVRREWPSIPVIAMSGGGRIGPADYLAAASEIGAVATLEKPFAVEVLIEAISAACRTRRSL